MSACRLSLVAPVGDRLYRRLAIGGPSKLSDGYDFLNGLLRFLLKLS